MPAHIRVTLRSSIGGPVVGVVTTDASRDDLRKGYEVECYSVDAATTYSWALAFTPDSSGPVLGGGDPFAGTPSGAAWLPPAGSTGRTAKYVVDWEGAYLVRLVVDAGLPTESTTYLRLRRLTQFGDIKLVAAGERRDQNGVIPADASAEGWANDQNQNLQRLTALVRRLSTSGRQVFVDVNKGRDNANNANDPNNIVNLPGADPTSLYTTGINLKAEGFGDFSSITDGIAYAMAAPSRGEPAPSATNPYTVVVRAGLYVENLVFQPNVHVLADPLINAPTEGNPLSSAVTVRTTNTPNARHEYNGGGEDVIIAGVTLENFGATSEPVFHCRGGVSLLNFTAVQKGTGLTQGPAIFTTGGKQQWLNCLFISEAMAGVDRYAAIVDGDIELTGKDIQVEGASGMLVNPSLDADCTVVLGSVAAQVELGYAVRGYPSFMVFPDSTFHFVGGAAPTVPLISIDNIVGGVGAASHDVNFGLNNTSFLGDISFDKTGTSGSTGFSLSHVITNGNILFPTGSPDSFVVGTLARSLAYEDQWVRPETGVKTVPALNALGTDNVQDTLDWLVNLTLPRAGTPFRGLTETYNGIASLNPLVYGQGLGRTMLADNGAMQVTGAASPMYLETDGLLRGGIQAEGIVDIGPLKNDGLGSEINLDPNTFGGGPLIKMGRDAWTDNLDPSNPRSLPAGLILAAFQSPAFPATNERPYNLLLRATNISDSGTGVAGRVVMDAGSIKIRNNTNPANTDAGSAYVQGGDLIDWVAGSVNSAGHVYLAPGLAHNDGENGRIRIVNPNGANWPRLQAVIAYNAADPTTGTFYMGTINGIESFFVGGTDTLNDVIDTINTTSRSFFGFASGGTHLRLTAGKAGDNGDFFYIGDDQGGALNAKLGELRTASGATYTPGSYSDYLEIECRDSGVLKVHGRIEAEGCGNSYYYHSGGAPYTLEPHVSVVGVDTTAPVGAILLPAGAPPGLQLWVKDEGGNAAVNNITIQADGGTFLEGGPQVINVNNDSFYAYATGVDVVGRGWKTP